MKLSQILKIAGSIVGALAGLVLVFKLLSELAKHPILVAIVIAGGLAFFAGKWFKKKGK